MKLFTKLVTALSVVTVSIATAAMAFGGVANADCYQYNANGFNTSTTPVFNNICGVPQIGNESDFVRIRQSSTTNATPTNDEAVGPTYSVGSISGVCNSGDLFDVWNYLHNDATATENPDTGSGSAVAHNVVENISAPLGKSSTSFKFSDTVTADNAATVSDSATLDCGSKTVQLSLVPGSVHTVTAPTGGWNDISDSSVNNPLKIGNPTWGSGDQWGCWNYRVLVVYEVKVTVVPPQTTPPTCNYITADEADIKSVNYTANSATNIAFEYNLYSGGTNGTLIASTKSSQNGYAFTNKLEEGKQYTVTAAVTSSNFANVTSANCAHTFTTPTTPPTPTPTPTPTPVTPTTPTTLVNTGPGSVVAIFAAVSVIASGVYYWVLRRRLAKR